MGLLCLLSSFTPTVCHHPPKHVSRLHVSLRQFGVQGSTAPVQLNVISPTPHRVIRARGGVRGHDIRQRLEVSQQHLKHKKVSSCRLGRFVKEMCRSGRSSAADLSACVSAGPTSEPTLRRLASAADVGPHVRKGKREQHHKHTARNTSRVLAKHCNAPPLYAASIPVWSEVGQSAARVVLR